MNGGSVSLLDKKLLPDRLIGLNSYCYLKRSPDVMNLSRIPEVEKSTENDRYKVLNIQITRMITILPKITHQT